jgi:hypothetical protein
MENEMTKRERRESEVGYERERIIRKGGGGMRKER